MCKFLENKWVLITGASSGFGAAGAQAFAAAGARLLLGARREERLAQVARAARQAGAPAVHVHRLDVTDPVSIRMFADWVKTLANTLDILVNNAGGARGLDPVVSGKDEDWDYMVQANVLGLARVTRALLPLLQANPGSTIINVGSTAGHTAYEGGAIYCAAKAGELQISRALRLELCGTGVRVCSLDPGLAETEFSIARFHGDTARAKKVYEGMVPLKAEDVAEAMVWIASRPPHVCIDEMLIKPTDQAALHKIHRRSAMVFP